MKSFDKLFLYSLPLLELGIAIPGLPIRFGELIFYLSVFRLLFISTERLSSFNKKGFYLVVLLFFLLVHTVFGGVMNYGDLLHSYLYKSIIRNFSYVLIMVGFVIKPLDINEIDFDKFMKYIVIFVSLCFALEFVLVVVLKSDLIDLLFARRQEKEIGKTFFLYRFSAPASEPGFIAPLLVIPYYYFLRKRTYRWMTLSILLLMLTFSTFSYLCLFVIPALYIFSTGSFLAKVKKGFRVFLVGAILLIASLPFTADILIEFYNKAMFFVGLGERLNWSALQRQGNMLVALDLAVNGDLFEIIVGRGTGFFGNYTRTHDTGLEITAEAHSLYVATLLERGIIGMLILLFFGISLISIPASIRQVEKADNSFPLIVAYGAIRTGLLIRLIQWVITSMLWRYYFFVEIAILISMEIFIRRHLDLQKKSVIN